MILESEQYDFYEIPIPSDIPHGKILDYVLRQTGKRHPCFEQQCKADILVTGWGKGRKALVTVVADEVLLELIAGQGALSRMRITSPVKRTVFSSGPVTQLHWQWWPLALPVAGVVLAACMTLAMKSSGNLYQMVSDSETQPETLESVTEYGMDDDVWLYADGDGGDDDMGDGITVDVEEVVEKENRLPEDALLVGTIFAVDGGKTVFYRDESGKLKTLSVFAK